MLFRDKGAVRIDRTGAGYEEARALEVARVELRRKNTCPTMSRAPTGGNH